MRRWPFTVPIAATILGTALLMACGLAEVFEPAGPADDVAFLFTPEPDVAVGDTVPLVVSVTAGGRPLENPSLLITSLTPGRLAVTAAGDSVVGLNPGAADIEVRLVSSIITGEAPDTVLRIQVRP